MQARRLIESSSYEPATLHILFKAFDEGWAEIAHRFDADAKQIEEARLRLAQAVLSVAREDGIDAERVKEGALKVMDLSYRENINCRAGGDEAIGS